MRSEWRKFVCGRLWLRSVFSLGTGSFRTVRLADEGKRKVKSKVAPAYPELANVMSVTG